MGYGVTVSGFPASGVRKQPNRVTSPVTSRGTLVTGLKPLWLLGFVDAKQIKVTSYKVGGVGGLCKRYVQGWAIGHRISFFP